MSIDTPLRARILRLGEARCGPRRPPAKTTERDRRLLDELVEELTSSIAQMAGMSIFDLLQLLKREQRAFGVGDNEAFSDALVDRLVGVLENE